MNDLDEAEAAHVATRAAQNQVVDDMIANAEAMGTVEFQQDVEPSAEQMVGEIMAFGRTLFQWESDEATHSFAYINLDHVSIVNWTEDGTLSVGCDGQVAVTKNPEVIARFWAEWEII